jgi:serine/threonine protein kinase
MSRLSIDTECRRTDLSSVQSEFDGQVPAEAQYSSMQDRLSVLWSFLSTFRSTNLHLVSENELFGGESAIAEGSTYVVDKRLMSTVDGLKTVAVKRLKRDFGKSIGGSAGGLTRTDVLNIVNDVRTMAQEPLASHPHIVQFLGYGWIERAGGISVFQAVEFSPFGSLKAMLREHSFSLDAKFDICHQVATGLNALHTTRVAHGDVKLENILVFDPFFQRPFPYILKISDFGSSVHDVDGRYTGTYLLNAPEVRDGTVNVKQEGETVEKFLRCDTYSFGILTWEVLLGGEGFSISAGREDRSEWLNESPPSGIIRISPYSVHALTSGNELIQSLFNAILESALASRPKDRMTMKRIKLLFDSYYFG